MYFLIAITSLQSSYAQMTKVRGFIVDATTKEPLPFVNIAFKNTTIGTITDFEGNFFLQSRNASDTIIFSMVGYETVEIKIKKYTFQELNIELQPSDIALNEIVVTPGENPAWRIMRNIVKNKKRNDPKRFEKYAFEAYNKMELDVNNVDDEFQNRKFLNKFEFAFNYVDTSAETGKSYLPVFISENISDFYYQKNPKRKKEIVKASQMSGVENESVAQYTGQMYVDVNIYENFYEFFDHQFVSPFSDFWRFTYKYYLLDSTYINGKYCYLMSFKPKRKQEFTFTGEFWVHDSTWAIKKVKARISDGINLNYIKDFIVQQEYSFIDDSVWFMTKEVIFADINLTEKSTGFFARKTTSRRNISMDPKYDEDFFTNKAPEISIVKENANSRDTAFWNAARHEKLSTKEQNIYQMVDSIKEIPAFRNVIDIVNMLAVGYYVHSWWEYGPYFKTYSYNPIEGHRFRFGGRTSNEFSKKLMLSGHIAYGTFDEKFKYGLGTMYMFSKMPRRSAGLYYKYDIEQLGQSVNAFTEDNILATLLSRSPNDNLLMVDETKGFYQHEWFEGFSSKIDFKYRNVFPSHKIPFKKTNTGQNWKNIRSFELSFSTHFGYNEKFVYGEFERYSFGSEYPTLDFTLTAGIKDDQYLKTKYEYYRLNAVVQHHFDFNPFGEFTYIIEGGKILGEVPFPLLKLHEGNETYAFDPYAFNMMNFYEFASDQFVSVSIEHHFHGFFLNKFPLLRKLKLREIIYAKALVGTLNSFNNNNEAIMDFPSTLGSVTKPYAEAGVGLENILKIFRVDALWRLSHLDNPDIPKFGIRVKVQIIL